MVENCFNENKKLHAVEDYHLWLRLLKTEDALKINLPLLMYRVHSADISKKKFKYSRKVFTVFNDLFEFPTSIYHFVNYAITHFFRILIR